MQEEELISDAYDEQDEPRPYTAEELIVLLASMCDGAKLRDGNGFSKGDSQDGRRLAAMVKCGLPWSPDDAQRALGLISRYMGQVARVLGGGKDGEREARKALRKAKKAEVEIEVRLGQEPVEGFVPHSYCLLSPDRRTVYLHIFRITPAMREAVESIKRMRGQRHGKRKIDIRLEKRVPFAMNGKRIKTARITLPFNGSTWPHVMKVCSETETPMDPSIEIGPDPVIDTLLRNTKALYAFNGKKGGVEAEWAVFDIDAEETKVIAMMKDALKGGHVLDRDEGWRWFVPVNKGTAKIISRLGNALRFSMDETMKDKLSSLQA